MNFIYADSSMTLHAINNYGNVLNYTRMFGQDYSEDSASSTVKTVKKM
jgi:hypothetical protein